MIKSAHILQKMKIDIDLKGFDIQENGTTTNESTPEQSEYDIFNKRAPSERSWVFKPTESKLPFLNPNCTRT
jgi:hypothetical protein